MADNRFPRKKRGFAAHNKRPAETGRVIAIVVFISVACAGFYFTFNGEESLPLLIGLNQESEKLRGSINTLETENKRQREDIQLLRNNSEAIEEEARSILNLVKKGETLFVFPKEEKDTK